MLTVSPQGIDLIKRFEGFSAEPYLCPAGKRTIGYGHVILPHERSLGPRISTEEADALLRQDLSIIEGALRTYVRTALSQHQCDALASFIYNVGVHAFSRSTLLRLLNEQHTENATKQFARWVYSNGKKLEGLIRRRAAEAELFARLE